MLTDLLINVSTGDREAPVVAVGLALAKSFGAHATGTAFGIEPTIPSTYYGGAAANVVAELRNAAEQEAREAADLFSKAAENAGVDHDAFSFISSIDGALSRFAQLTRLHDLTVVGQPNPDRPGPEEEFLRTALFESGRAVLIIPYIQKTPIELNRVMVAWDGGRAATRAVAEAMPLLSRAKQVEILVVETGRTDEEEIPGADLARHLARHKLKVDLRRVLAPSRRDIDSMILNAVTDSDIDLVVMGGYGHSRLRDFVFGGATGGVVESMTAPVLMAN